MLVIAVNSQSEREVALASNVKLRQEMLRFAAKARISEPLWKYSRVETNETDTKKGLDDAMAG